MAKRGPENENGFQNPIQVFYAEFDSDSYQWKLICGYKRD